MVTKIALPTMPQGKLWSGMITYPGSTAADILKALYEFVMSPQPDDYANIVVSLGWAEAMGEELAASNLYHSGPEHIDGTPASLLAFASTQPQIVSSFKHASVL